LLLVSPRGALGPDDRAYRRRPLRRLCDFDPGHDHRAGRPGGPFCDTSTPFSVLIGFPVFGERMPGGKALAALTIVTRLCS
jgi:hypothetical protein